MLSKVRVKVNGKINLSLNITGVKDGFHLLDSVVASVSVSDYITVRDRLDDKINLIFNADFVPKDNTVMKAVGALRKKFGNFGADIIVDKHIPLAGGMGGSSADAAGIIAAFTKLFDFDKRGLDERAICREVGSDVFYMLRGGYARMQGIGDEVLPFACDRDIGFVYIYGGETLTGEVYAAYDKLGGDGEVDNDELIKMLNGGGKIQLGNMLFRAACSLNPIISTNADAIRDIGLAPNMTGSGSVVYAVSSDPERDAAVLKARGLSADFAFIRPHGIEYV